MGISKKNKRSKRYFGPKHRNDGHDQERIDAAQVKRERKNEKRRMLTYGNS